MRPPRRVDLIQRHPELDRHLRGVGQVGAKLLRRVGVIIMFRFASIANALRMSSFVATLRSTIRVLGESCVKQYMISSMPSSVSWLRSTYENLDES